MAEALAQQIANGELGLGQRLPSERELMARFGVSRATVREAVGRISELGLVRRRQGARTEVISRTPRARYVMSARSVEDIVRYARTTFLEVRERRRVEVGARRAERLGFAPGRHLVYLRGVRREVGTEQAIGMTEVYVDARFATALEDPPRVESAIFAAIEARFGITVGEVVQEFSAVALGRGAAAALGLPPGTPALRIVRRYLAAGEPVEVAINDHPSHAFAYETRFVLEETRPRPDAAL